MCGVGDGVTVANGAAVGDAVAMGNGARLLAGDAGVGLTKTGWGIEVGVGAGFGVGFGLGTTVGVGRGFGVRFELGWETTVGVGTGFGVGFGLGTAGGVGVSMETSAFPAGTSSVVSRMASPTLMTTRCLPGRRSVSNTYVCASPVSGPETNAMDSGSPPSTDIWIVRVRSLGRAATLLTARCYSAVTESPLVDCLTSRLSIRYATYGVGIIVGVELGLTVADGVAVDTGAATGVGIAVAAITTTTGGGATGTTLGGSTGRPTMKTIPAVATTVSATIQTTDLNENRPLPPPGE